MCTFPSSLQFKPANKCLKRSTFFFTLCIQCTPNTSLARTDRRERNLRVESKYGFWFVFFFSIFCLRVASCDSRTTVIYFFADRGLFTVHFLVARLLTSGSLPQKDSWLGCSCISYSNCCIAAYWNNTDISLLWRKFTRKFVQQFLRIFEM